MQSSLFRIISLAPLLALPVLADFHISTEYNTALTSGTSSDTWTSYAACPSDYYNCACLTNGDRTGNVEGDFPNGFFYISAGFCGMPQMNFYPQSDGTVPFYINDGDGSVIGTCYPNDTFSKECGIVDGTTEIMGDMVCYSYACNP